MRVALSFASASILLLVISSPVPVTSLSATQSNTSDASPMKEAIWNGDLPAIQRLLASGTDALNIDTRGEMPYLAPWEWAVLAGNNDALKLLLEKVTRIPPRDDSSQRRLATAAGMNNIVSTRELLRHGLPVDILSASGNGTTALMIAAAGGRTEVMKLLLDAGANPQLQDRRGDSSLMAAVRIGSLEAVRMLQERGVDPNQRDIDGRTALIWAARTGRLDIVNALLEKGADISLSDSAGQNALMVATAKGHTAVASALRERGATATGSSFRNSPLTARVAVEKSISLLQRGAATWVERAGCGACHHRPMIDRLTAVARQHRFAVDEELAGVRRQARGRGAAAGAPAFDLAWIHHHEAESAVPRDPTREEAALSLAQMQLKDGRWNPGPPRVPISGSPFVVTAAAARVIQAYGPTARSSEMAAHVDHARLWLLANTPKETQDEVFRMMGLRWTGADPALVTRAAEALKRGQNADGGWTQLPGMNSDAYATGQVLVALHDVGMPVTDPIYRRGIDYLLRTQEPDGSWLVHTRAVPQNVYLESGFPHGKFQFISFAGSCYATMALIYAAEPSE